jgi:hypothetical protein
MSERVGDELGVPCWVGAAPSGPGGAVATLSQLVVGSRGV